MMTQTIHAAKIIDRGDTFWFASLDGQTWVEVNIDPRGASPEQIQGVLDGNGRMKPMTMALRFLQHRGAEFLKEG